MCIITSVIFDRMHQWGYLSLVFHVLNINCWFNFYFAYISSHYLVLLWNLEKCVFHGISPLHLCYQICRHRVAHSIPYYYLKSLWVIVVATDFWHWNFYELFLALIWESYWLCWSSWLVWFSLYVFYFQCHQYVF